MESNSKMLLGEVADYYSEKLVQHGETPQGVDWNGEDGQILRFEQLSTLFHPSPNHFSVNDLGCGYGAFYDYLIERNESFSYTGIDVSEEMIHVATQRYQEMNNAGFLLSNKPVCVADYGVASGIFNVRLNQSNEKWLLHLKNTLDILDQTSRRGFAFNCLTSYSDADKMRDYLFYADPCCLFDLCKHRYSRNVALLHDYDLYEFTILVRKEL